MKNIEPGASLTVDDLFNKWGQELELVLVAGQRGVTKLIASDRVQKPGLRMVETNIDLDQGKVQILGRTELEYFSKLSASAQTAMSEVFSHKNVPCFIITKQLEVPAPLIKACEEKGMPLFGTKKSTGVLITFLNEKLEEEMAPHINMHGLLIDIYGISVLLLGKSGIGKSESALDLINKGAKLIADDVVLIHRLGTSRLLGSGPGNIKHLMEIRGVGIINIKDMFGTASVLDKREIEMVIELKAWGDDIEYDRLGLDNNTTNIMGIELPYMVLPVSPGRNTSTIIEVAVRSHILKSKGIAAIKEYISDNSED